MTGITSRSGDKGCFGGVGFGHEDALEAQLAGDGSHGQDAARMAHAAVQGELADHQAAVHQLGVELLGADQHAQGDGQVVGWSFFTDRGGSQVDYQALAREEQPGVLDGSLDAVLGFLNGFVGEADDIHTRQSVTGIDFDLDDDAFQTNDGAGVDSGQHRVSVE